MNRFFVPNIPQNAGAVRLPDAEAHHALRVLRVAPGESVVLLDGEGGEFQATVGTVGRREVEVILGPVIRHAPPRVPLTLIQAIAKGPAMEGLIHRAVELGCSRVVPLLAERSVSRPDDAPGKRARWETVALEACKQSGNPWRMKIDLPTTPKAWLTNSEKPELLLVASLESPQGRIRDILQEHRQVHGRLPDSLGILIGPEGDFSPAEYAAFREAGARPVTLGPHVLRVETAVTAVLAMLRAELDAPSAG